MGNRIIDIRLVIMDSTEEDKDIPDLIEKIKLITGINRDTEILKACIRKAYSHFYSKLEK